MKKNLRIHTFLLALLFFSFLPEGRSQEYLQAQGQKIVNESGNEVILRGIGLGGWMLQEGYMLKTSGAQHEIEAKIEELIGPERKQEFYDAWLANHTRKIDIDSMAVWGYNSVRLPMHYKLYTPPIEEEPVEGEITWREKGFEMTDQLLEWAKANNMYLILDLHAAPGGQGENADINDYDPTKPSLWESEANQEKTIALWRKLAERYANEPNIGGYDLINEPNWGFQNHANDPNGCAESENTLLWDLQRKITEAIREVDQQHMVIIEGNCWGNNYNGLPQLWDDNMVISFHKYWNPNTEGAIQGMLNMRQERDVPVWLGETGENSNSWFTDAISLLEDNEIGWAWWPLKKLGHNNPLQIVVNPGYQEILDYWGGSADKPSEDQAYEALMQLAENLKLENNIYQKGVVDAMIRQPHSNEALPFGDNSITATETSRIFATDYDLGRHGVAYQDNEYTNTTGQAGGLAWNQGYSYRNDGVDIEPNQDEISNGYNVGWTADGEWLQYTLQVEEEGYYTIGIRTAGTNANGVISLSANGLKISGPITLPNTGDYQAWETTQVQDVYLESGTNQFKVLIEKGGFNLNYLEFSRQDAPASDQPGLLEGSIYHQETVLKLVFNQKFNPIPEEHGFTVKVNNDEVAIQNVNLKEGTRQVILLELAAPVSYGDQVQLSYTGESLNTSHGVGVDPFTDVDIRVLSALKILAVPGKIETEDFTTNSGFEFEESSDTGGGQNAGYTDPGDYLDFTVLVEESGYYDVLYRIASESAGGNLKLQVVQDDGTTEDLSKVSFDATGGWQSWSTATGSQAYLEEGLHTLRLLAESSLFNINWFRLNGPNDPTEPEPTGLREEAYAASLVAVYPNPTQGRFKIDLHKLADKPHRIWVKDALGKTVYVQKLIDSPLELEVEVEETFPKGLYLIVIINKGKPITKKLIIH